MKKLLIIFSLFALTLSLSGQGIMMGVVGSVGAAATKTHYHDDFEAYSTGDLATQGSWVYGYAEVSVVDVSGDNRATANGVGAGVQVKYNATFNDNQYAQITLESLGSGSYIGVGVRYREDGNSIDGYILGLNSTTAYLERIDNLSKTVLASGAISASAGDVLRLEVSGTTLSCYLNGNLITSLDTDGRVTDNTYSSGVVGISGYGTDAATSCDNWEGGDL